MVCKAEDRRGRFDPDQLCLYSLSMKILYMGKEDKSPASGTTPTPDRIETSHSGLPQSKSVNIVFLRYAQKGQNQSRTTAGVPERDIHVAGYSLSLEQAEELRSALDEAIKGA